jgi:hypothetical protein
MTRGEVEERGDGDTGDNAKLLGRTATGALSHVPARLWGRRRVELPGRGHVRAPWPPGCCDRQGSMATLARLQADEVGGLGV